MRKRNKWTVTGLITLALGAALLAGCSDDNNASNDSTAQETKQLVNDYSMKKLSAERASINSHQLVITNDNKETSYDLPQNEFFVSIAPYVNQTHPCAVHNLTSCQGELIEQEFDVYIEDEDGNVVVDEKKKTFANGFIDIWVPRDKEYTVTIEQDGKSATTEFSSFKGDNTCITTMQLQ